MVFTAWGCLAFVFGALGVFLGILSVVFVASWDLQVGHQAHSKVVQDSGDLDQAGEVLKVGLVDGADLLDTGDLALRVLR